MLPSSAGVSSVFGGRPSSTSASRLCPARGPSLSIAVIVGPLSAPGNGSLTPRPGLQALAAQGPLAEMGPAPQSIPFASRVRCLVALSACRRRTALGPECSPQGQPRLSPYSQSSRCATSAARSHQWALDQPRLKRAAPGPTRRCPRIHLPLHRRSSFAGTNRVSDGTRTRGRRDHNPELYQLSYAHQDGAEHSAARRASPGPDSGRPKGSFRRSAGILLAFRRVTLTKNHPQVHLAMHAPYSRDSGNGQPARWGGGPP